MAAAEEMHKINPKILEWARETAGLNLEDAAARLGIRDARQSKAVERLASLESGVTAPSRAMLVKMAKAYRRPLLTFYLSQPPVKGPRGQDFRTLPGDYSVTDEALIDALIREVGARQGIVLEALQTEDEAQARTFVGSIDTSAGVHGALKALHAVLGISRKEYRAAGTAEDAFKALRRQAELAGVFVVLQGDLGSHHSVIPVEAFRGFALADAIAPFVVINDNDSVPAWSFTLLHELAHLLLGETGVSGGRAESKIERFCNDVASRFLLPDDELRLIAIGNNTDRKTAEEQIAEFARPRLLSQTMVAYRLYTADAISYDYWLALRDGFRQRWIDSRAQRRERARLQEGGPNYYVVRRHRVGTALIDLVSRMLRSGALTTTKAAKVLAVKPQNLGAFLAGSGIDTWRAA